MDEFDQWVSEVERIVAKLSDILRELEAGHMTPREAILRFEGSGAIELYSMEAMADSWRLAYAGGRLRRLPRGYNHVACSKAGARMYILESAIYAVASDIFIELLQWDDASDAHKKVAGLLIRAEEHLAELKWYRRLFARGAGRISGIQDLRNSIRSVRDMMSVIDGFIRIRDVDAINGHIDEFNTAVIGEVVRKIHGSKSGHVEGLSRSKISQARHALLQLQADMMRYRSSWSILCARESVAISSAVLDWGRYRLNAEHPYAPLIRDDANRAYGSAKGYRWDRWSNVPWFVLKRLYGTLGKEPAPNWTNVLPKGPELSRIRATLGKWLDGP